MCEWACQQCREAFWGNPSESGLCIACEQDNEQPAGEVTSDDD